MNLSGAAVRSFSNRRGFSPEQLLILHDELDFPCGKVRFKQGGGEGGHNGLRSISWHLKSRDYWRLRIGIGKSPSKAEGQNYVLQPPAPVEQLEFNKLVRPVAQALLEFVRGDKEEAMHALHSRC